jgi:hypothetical protein
MKTKKRFVIVGGIALIFSVLAGSMVVEAWGHGRCFGRDFHEGPCGGAFHRGFGGGKDMPDFIIRRMDKKVKDLNLNATQKEKYDKLRTGIKSRLVEATEGHKALREEICVEMTKEIPDIDILAPKLKAAMNSISVTVQDSIDLFVAFNASLDKDQKKQLANGFKERMAR